MKTNIARCDVVGGGLIMDVLLPKPERSVSGLADAAPWWNGAYAFGWCGRTCFSLAGCGAVF
jgi:hypothetical protein